MQIAIKEPTAEIKAALEKSNNEVVIAIFPDGTIVIEPRGDYHSEAMNAAISLPMFRPLALIKTMIEVV